jgi:hypothetical protein
MSFYLVSSFDYKTVELPKKIAEWCLDSYLAPGEVTVRDIYRKYGYDTVGTAGRPIADYQYSFQQKDSLGIMRCIIIGEDKNREIEIVKAPVSLRNVNKTGPYIFDHNTQTVVNRNGDLFTCFRVAVNTVRKPLKN